ncbi:MAG TPA: DeoR/GlpR family DNA-binding transcription regulator [Gaiellaceae bacterium]|jgi:DeoR/GlpR family transcriptional regulator of sugar metabolism|nr:DeoR/GlpR family DNA-binding transcription regulator [Gaiellaceae bacterium]
MGPIDGGGGGGRRESAPLAAERRNRILDHVLAHGAVRVRDLVAMLAVSDMTIRRDLEALARRGLVAKVHGGATAVRPHTTDEPGFLAKQARHEREKELIATRAARLVQAHTAIALSAGTTTWTLAQRLVRIEDLTVVTNSIPVAEVFARTPRPDRTVVLTGGIRTRSDALVGPLAVNTIRSLNVDQVFLGVHGMAPLTGFTSPNFLEAETDRALVEAARQTIVLADSTKWETVGLATICAFEAADVLVTDAGLQDAARALLAADVGELVVVDDAAD